MLTILSELFGWEKRWISILNISSSLRNEHKLDRFPSSVFHKPIHSIIFNESNIEKGRQVRIDCTVVESNIHKPYDSALLWDAGSEQWARGADSRGVWRRGPSEPELVLSPKELQHLTDIGGQRVAVLGSGDNQVVFALAGLGAIVTSVDISQNQLDVARDRAQELGLSVF